MSPRPWGFWGTLGWGALSFGTTFAIEVGLIVGYLVWWQSRHPDESLAVDALMSDGTLLSIATITGTPILIGMLALAARLKRWPVGEYLGLIRPRGRDVLLGVISIAAFLLAFHGLTSLLGVADPPFVADAYRTARTAGVLSFLWLSLVVFAPVGEEVLFRGFLFRGWAHSRLGVVGTVLVTSALWAVTHVQYDLAINIGIFCGGLLLGWLRWRSGSTTLTILLHALNNLAALLLVAVKV